MILIAASLTVTVKQFGGRPIECAVGKELAGEVVNNYCWIHSSFTTWNLNGSRNERISRMYNHDPELILMDRGFRPFIGSEKLNRKNVVRYGDGPLPGYGPYPGVQTTREDTVNRHHKYYQWVAGMLLVQVSDFD